MPKPWTKLSDKEVLKAYAFSVREQRMRSPEGDFEDDFQIIKLYDWVNVLPITADNKVVLVKQYRLGSEQTGLELPGGMLDSDDEDPKGAAMRELVEETGYNTSKVKFIGKVHPNPAMQTNWCHFYLAENVELKESQSLDPAERIEVVLVDLKDLPRLIQEEEVTHSMSASGLLLYLLHEQKYKF